MTEYIVQRPLVRERYYEQGETIMLTSDDAEGLLAIEPGIIVPKSAAQAMAQIVNQLEPWTDFAEIIDAIRAIDIPITEDGWMPPLRGGDTPDVQTALAMTKVYAKQKKLRVLELGTAYGNLAANIVLYARNAVIDTVCALPEQISGEIITKAFTKEEIGRQLRMHGDLTGGPANIIYANTMNLAAEDLGDEYDLCIIDACHDVEYAINDLYTCVNVLSQSGVVLLHDVYPGSGPYQALQLYDASPSSMIVRTLPGTWWAVAAWKDGWARLENWLKTMRGAA